LVLFPKRAVLVVVARWIDSPGLKLPEFGAVPLEIFTPLEAAHVYFFFAQARISRDT
jgi:hypothetical protein